MDTRTKRQGRDILRLNLGLGAAATAAGLVAAAAAV